MLPGGRRRAGPARRPGFCAWGAGGRCRSFGGWDRRGGLARRVGLGMFPGPGGSAVSCGWGAGWGAWGAMRRPAWRLATRLSNSRRAARSWSSAGMARSPRKPWARMARIIRWMRVATPCARVEGLCIGAMLVIMTYPCQGKNAWHRIGFRWPGVEQRCRAPRHCATLLPIKRCSSEWNCTLRLAEAHPTACNGVLLPARGSGGQQGAAL